MLEVIKITKEIAWMFLLNIFIVYVSSMIKTNFMLIIKKNNIPNDSKQI